MGEPATVFSDRSDAGRALAQRLGVFAHRDDVIVLALPRGGVVVGYEVARALNAPLDALVVRKLGIPGHPEVAMGAIASGGASVLDLDIVRLLELSQAEIEAVIAREHAELVRRERAYRRGAPAPRVAGLTVLLVDDGLATGATMRAAIRALRERGPARIVVAAPVGALQICAELRDEADEVVCARTPEPFEAVGSWYEDFSETSDDEVRELLARAAREYAGDAVRGAQGRLGGLG
jgi:putative phosphoribosyl transferase